MTKKNQKAELYTNDLLDSLLSEITPEEQERTNQRMLLAAKIDDARKQKGLSKGEFADLMGKKPSEISRWLSGTHNFTSDTLTDIQGILGVRLLDTEKEPKEVVAVHYNFFVTGSEVISSDKINSLYSKSVPYASLRADC
ncbi:MAG: helix-turn-helix transcriptional regulator [Salinivirgaceae bacterium]|jgi:transcriptional regulator with XRE-family HTH domain